MSTGSRVSFVVPTHNEERYLPETLEHIHQAARSCGVDYELIVVDDDSSDNTAVTAVQAGATVIRVQLRKISAVRNAGAREANGDVFFFVDADTLISEELLRDSIKAIEMGAIGGGATPVFEKRPPIFFHLSLRLIGYSFRLLRWAAGCFVFAAREPFEAIGGFDENLYASEEVTFSRAMKRRGNFVIVSTPVITSGRKAEAYSQREMFLLAMKLLLKGPRALRRRDGLELWYDRRNR